ncbi:tail fiber assembly protein [Buttiauxella sp. B2]|uniref:tail fiber assembly protein n=1 Tax=Buttiauxella sp. B2 TaxID=2587812 RepID=UPI00111E074E|nr:tail fiber assembly protein [Buttiauxella sp. B2]TNV22485.1 tail fiber assembly protein [Buttiauxella sp. B2]
MHSQLFSNKTRAFYPVKSLRYYKSCGTLPDDLVRICDDEYANFYGASPASSVPNYNNKTGQMEWLKVTPKVRTKKEIKEDNQSEQKSRLREAASMAFPLQAAVDIDAATTKQIDTLKLIKRYTVDVLNTNLDSVKPEWPESPISN